MAGFILKLVLQRVQAWRGGQVVWQEKGTDQHGGGWATCAEPGVLKILEPPYTPR